MVRNQQIKTAKPLFVGSIPTAAFDNFIPTNQLATASFPCGEAETAGVAETVAGCCGGHSFSSVRLHA
jgi:hypothetical protein